MKKRHMTIALVVLVGILTGCAKQLTRDLRSGVYPMGYIQDSEICSEKRPVRVAIGQIRVQKALDDFTFAKTRYVVPVPLLLLNLSFTGYSCKLGEASLGNALGTFMKESFIKEARRSGCFQVVADGSQDYTIDLTVIDQNSGGPYSTWFYLYFALYAYGYGYGFNAGPAQSSLVLRLDIHDRDSTAVRRQFKSTHVARIPSKRNQRKAKIQRDFVVGMVESLSFAYKDCIEKSVTTINQHIQDEQITTGREAPLEQSGGIEVIEE